MKNKLFRTAVVSVLALVAVPSCNSYLDIVPNDGIATLEMAFKMRSQAIKYLSSCYSYLTGCTPGVATYEGFSAGDEIYATNTKTEGPWNAAQCQIFRGYQNVTSPINDDFTRMYQAFRYCNTLVDNINRVPDMEQWEKDMWAAEAKTLKAYYMFHLVRKYGPIPIVRENLEISASVDESRLFRDNIDDCFDYILELLEEAIPALYNEEQSLNDKGRITKPIAAMLRAKVAVTAASPLFNNNDDQASLVSQGKRLFPSKSAEDVQDRWDYAVEACSQAIEICHEAGKSLYYYSGAFSGDSHLKQELTLREVICESWNSETVWGSTYNYSANTVLQRVCAIINNEKYVDLFGLHGHQYYHVPMKIPAMFYTKRGLPVENDVERCDVDPIAIRTVSSSDDERWVMQEGYSTAEFNFDREPRFYADFCFDGNYMLSSIASNQQPSNLPKVQRNLNANLVTGYSTKKTVKYSLVVNNSASYSITRYVYPIFRLADLYLLYAEAINEAEGPDGEHSAEMFKYIDEVRIRAGIPGVKEAWSEYSNEPDKYKTKAGMREIIHRERGIEMAMEGERFWDLRRWKEVIQEYNKGIDGWNTNYPALTQYYNIKPVFSRVFSQKDYFWPLSTAVLENNKNLVQNLGW